MFICSIFYFSCIIEYLLPSKSTGANLSEESHLQLSSSSEQFEQRKMPIVHSTVSQLTDTELTGWYIVLLRYQLKYNVRTDRSCLSQLWLVKVRLRSWRHEVSKLLLDDQFFLLIQLVTTYCRLTLPWRKDKMSSSCSQLIFSSRIDRKSNVCPSVCLSVHSVQVCLVLIFFISLSL